MFGNPSLMTRIAIGKALGFVVGGIAFLFLPHFWPDAGLLLRWGILLWYTTLGAIIGVFGLVNRRLNRHLPANTRQKMKLRMNLIR